MQGASGSSSAVPGGAGNGAGPPGPRPPLKGTTVTLGGLTFSGAFDSGHLGTVRRASDGAFEISLQPDFDADAYKVWYYFSVTGGQPGRRIRCRIVNMHPIASVYSKDLRPLVRIPAVSLSWERLQSPASFLVTPAFDLVLTWDYTFVAGPATPVFFAFYYPFPYADCQRLLDNVDRALVGLGAFTPASDPAALAAAPPDALYYARELLTLTPDGRRVELLTITSVAGINLEEREPGVEGLFPPPPPSSPPPGAGAGGGGSSGGGATPSSSASASLPLVVTGSAAGGAASAATDTTSPSTATAVAPPRPHRFRGKPGVFVSARVHPAETASSYMLHGLLALLLQPRNAHARALRDGFVFKLVPMLCPDGVARGHFRLDQYGVNLNRAYGCPSKRDQPSIYAAKHVIKQVATLCSPAPARLTPPAAAAGLTPASRATPPLPANGLALYLDLHGFSARSGCYVLGNALPPGKAARALTFATLLQLYAPQFNAAAASIGKGLPGAAALAAGGKGGGVPLTERDSAAQTSRMAAVSSMRAALAATAAAATRSGGAAAAGAANSSSNSKIVRPPQLFFADTTALGALRTGLLALTTQDGPERRASAEGVSSSVLPVPVVGRDGDDATATEDEAEADGAQAESSIEAVEAVVPAPPDASSSMALPTPGDDEEDEDDGGAASDEDDDGSDSDVGEDDEGGDEDEDIASASFDDDDEDEEDGGGGRGRGRRGASRKPITRRRGSASRRRGGASKGATAKSRALQKSSGSGSALAAADPLEESTGSSSLSAGSSLVNAPAPAPAAASSAPSSSLINNNSSLTLTPKRASTNNTASSNAKAPPLSETDVLSFFASGGAAATGAPPASPEEVEAAAVAAAVAAVGPGVAVSLVPRGAPGTAPPASSPVLRLLDPTAVYSPTLPLGVRGGPAEASLHELEYRRLTREWRAMKERVQLAAMAQPVGVPGAAGSSGKGELRKGGTGRARVAREYGTTLAFTVECSCNLLSHGLALHRAHMFRHGGGSDGTSAGSAASTTGTELRFPLAAPYLAAHAEFYLHPALGTAASAPAAAAAAEGAATGAPAASELAPTALLICPAAARAGVSQRHEGPRVYEAVPPPPSPSWLLAARGRSAATAPYMCAVDALQPPAPAPRPGGSAAPAGNSGGGTAVLIDPTPPSPASSSSGGASSTAVAAVPTPKVDVAGLPVYAHTQPFGGAALSTPPSAPAPAAADAGGASVATLTCGWGTCPNDPPAVFAAAGRAVGFALLDIFGLTAARDPALAPLAVVAGAPRPSPSSLASSSGTAAPGAAPTALRSKLSETVWGDLPGLHAWSRAVTGAEAASAAGGAVVVPPTPAALAAATSAGGGPLSPEALRATALTPLVRAPIAALLTTPPHGYAHAVVFPLLRGVSPWRLARAHALAPPTGAELIPYLPHSAFTAPPAAATAVSATVPGGSGSGGGGSRGAGVTASTPANSSGGGGGGGASSPLGVARLATSGATAAPQGLGRSRAHSLLTGGGAAVSPSSSILGPSSPLKAAGAALVAAGSPMAAYPGSTTTSGGGALSPPSGASQSPLPHLPTADLSFSDLRGGNSASSSAGATAGGSVPSPYAPVPGVARGLGGGLGKRRHPGGGHYHPHPAAGSRRDAAAIAAGALYLGGSASVSSSSGSSGGAPAAESGTAPAPSPPASTTPAPMPRMSSNLLVPGINAEALASSSGSANGSGGSAATTGPGAAAAPASPPPPSLLAAPGSPGVPVLTYSTVKLIKAFSTALQLQPALEGTVAALGASASPSGGGGGGGGSGGAASPSRHIGGGSRLPRS